MVFSGRLALSETFWVSVAAIPAILVWARPMRDQRPSSTTSASGLSLPRELSCRCAFGRWTVRSLTLTPERPSAPGVCTTTNGRVRAPYTSAIIVDSLSRHGSTRPMNCWSPPLIGFTRRWESFEGSISYPSSSIGSFSPREEDPPITV